MAHELEDTEVIRRQMEQTRTALADKLETLEQHVVGTVQDTTSAVSDTAEKVTGAVEGTVDAVKETVDSVKQAFDLRLQVERHPWIMLGGSVALGYLIGSVLQRGGTNGKGQGQVNSFTAATSLPPAAAVEKPAPQPSMLGRMLRPELEKVKALALGALVGVVRDAVTRSMPTSLEHQVYDVMDRITNKLGGDPVPGPVLDADAESGKR